jgi:23S rRNA pseudouridine1911/1915/1917 synthase
VIAAADDGARLDAALARAVPALSRARIQALLAAGRVSTAGAEVRLASRRVKAGERFTITVPPPATAVPQPQAIPVELLHEDADLVVLVKPAGLVVHPAPGHDDGTLVNALLERLGGTLSGIGGVARPGIVHRLDKDVSGVMVVAKNDRTHTALSAQFTVHSVERVYEALVWNVPTSVSGTIDRPLARDPRDRKRISIVMTGKRAVTHWRMIQAGTRLLGARLQVELETGRTHQIRVHLASIGHPILGDPLYGPRRFPPVDPATAQAIRDCGRILLHARTLGFTHPRTQQRLRFDVPPPPLFDRIMPAL